MEIRALDHKKLYQVPQGLMSNNSKLNYSHNHSSKSTTNTSRYNSDKMSLRNLCYPKEILEAIVANKGQIIREMKSYDKRNNGLISRFEVLRSFFKANYHPSLSMNNINEIIQVYADNKDYIDYFNLITSLIKEVKQILKGTSFSKYSFDDLSSTFNNKFRLGKLANFNDEKSERKNLSVSLSN